MDLPSDTLAASETMESKIEKCMDIGTVLPLIRRMQRKFRPKTRTEWLKTQTQAQIQTQTFSETKLHAQKACRKLSDKTKTVKNIIIEEVRKDMDSQRTLIKNLSSDLKDQREELEVAKR